MESTHQVHDFLLNNAMNMTQRWLDSREHDGTAYDVKADPETVGLIKKQNQQFIKIVSGSLIGESDYTDWAAKVGENRAKSQTELSEVLKNFKKFREIFMSFVIQFAEQSGASVGELGNWVNQINYKIGRASWRETV